MPISRLFPDDTDDLEIIADNHDATSDQPEKLFEDDDILYDGGNIKKTFCHFCFECHIDNIDKFMYLNYFQQTHLYTLDAAELLYGTDSDVDDVTDPEAAVSTSEGMILS